MEMTIKKDNTVHNRYEFKCRFSGDKLRKIKTDCKLEINDEDICWDIKYSSKFFCFHQTSRERISKNLIRDISLKKVYAKKYGVTLAMIGFFLLYFGTAFYIMLLSEGDMQWIIRGITAFLAGIILVVLWYLVSRISVLQVTTVDEKKYRIPFKTRKLENEYEESVKRELLRRLAVRI